MTDWATFVVVREDGGFERYHRRYGAIDVDLDLLAGPDLALSHHDAGTGRTWGEDDWIQEGWCEAVALIDLRRRVLLRGTVEGAATSQRLRPTVERVLRRAWPGWTLRWAHDGIADVRAHLGLDVEPVRDRWSTPFLSPVLGPGEDGELAEDDPHVSVVTTAAGRCVLLDGIGRHPVTEGPALLGRLAGAPDRGSHHLRARSGLHLDPVARTLGWWLLGMEPQAAELAGRWPGWRVRFWADLHQEHVRASLGRFGPPPVDPAAALAELREAAHDHWSDWRHARNGEDDRRAALAALDAACRAAAG
ncbi:hypothetical protein BX265_5327 [Streptomyces sp. TLI_235]|nr:hypothetical protein [Streptomyces sp. TLI_235]PBC70770.1 hypothetical protein BX265_5327 [Streptomyces sp. TLI_235]